jgi:hypothetical protein
MIVVMEVMMITPKGRSRPVNQKIGDQADEDQSPDQGRAERLKQSRHHTRSSFTLNSTKETTFMFNQLTRPLSPDAETAMYEDEVNTVVDRAVRAAIEAGNLIRAGDAIRPSLEHTPDRDFPSKTRH